jgi:hypothetical protein
MDIAYISALSALAGSVVGGLTSGITTWLGLRAQTRAGQFAHNKSQREDLYRDFIVAAHSVWQCRREQRAPSSDPFRSSETAFHGIIGRKQATGDYITILAISMG